MLTVRKSLAWTFSEQALQFLLQFVASVAIARLLSPAEVGIFAIAMATQVVITSLGNFGVGSYLIREERLTDDKIRTAFGAWLIISFSLGALVFLTREFMAASYGAAGVSQALAVTALTFFIAPFGAPASALLSREMRFDVLHHIGLAGTAAGAATAITLAALGFSYMALAWSLVVGAATRSLLLLTVKRDHLRLLPSLRRWRDVLSFGGWLTGATLAGTASTEFTKFILAGMLGPSVLALYERAVQIPFMLRQALFTPLGRVLFPLLSDHARKGIDIGPAVLRVVEASTALVWPAFLAISLLSEPLVVAIFGDQWLAAGTILPYVLLAHAILVVLPQPDQILVPYGRVRRLFALRTATMIVNLSGAFIGALHGLTTYAMLLPLISTAFVIMAYFAMRQHLSILSIKIFAAYSKALLVAAVTALPALGVRLQYDSVEVPITALTIAAALGAALWLATIRLLNHSLNDEICRLTSTLRGASAKHSH